MALSFAWMICILVDKEDSAIKSLTLMRKVRLTLAPTQWKWGVKSCPWISPRRSGLSGARLMRKNDGKCNFYCVDFKKLAKATNVLVSQYFCRRYSNSLSIIKSHRLRALHIIIFKQSLKLASCLRRNWTAESSNPIRLNNKVYKTTKYIVVKNPYEFPHVAHSSIPHLTTP